MLGMVAILLGSLAAGSSVAGATDDDDAYIVPVSGSWSFAGGTPGVVEELPGGGTRESGATWTFQPVEVSDPRLDGPTVSTSTLDTHSGLSYFVNVVRLETVGGSWQREPAWTIAAAPSEGVPLATVWVGEGPYDGLLLVAECTFSDGIVSLEGHIIESDMPSLPTNSVG